MAYGFGSQLNSANSVRRKIGLYVWILVITLSGVSPSETSGVTETSKITASLLATSWSERDYPMSNLLAATSQNFGDISSLDPPIQHGSMFVDISTYEASSTDVAVRGSMISVGPSHALSLTNTPTNSDTVEVMSTTTLAQDLPAIHTTEIYSFSGKATVSSVDIPLDPDFELTTESTILPQPFSDVTILPSEDHSHTTPIISTDYLPISSTGWQTSANETTSEWEQASLQPEPPQDANLSTLLHQSGSLAVSPVILHTASSSSTGVYFQQHVDTKEWAVPVTVCLSVALLVAVVVIILTCRRLKTGYDGPRYFRGEAGTEVNVTENKQRETTTVQSVPEMHPRYKQPMHVNELDSPRDDRNLNVGQRDVAKGRKGGTKSSPAPGAIAGRQTFEMDHMLPAERANVYSQQNEQPNQEEFYRRNEEMYYDDHSFIHGSPNSRRGFSERIQHSPKSGNRAVFYKEDMAYTFDKTSQTEFETSTASSQMPQHKLKIKTRNVNNSQHSTPIIDSSDSRFSYNLATQDRQDLAESEQNDYNNSKDGHVSDEYRSEHCWESWNDPRYAKRERDSARVSVSGDHRSINDEDNNSMEGFYPDVRDAPHGRTDTRPVMYKCVSFDESRARATDDTYNYVSSDKSPTRKISTMSESAMTYLSVPREGFIPMSSAYETVDDLSEVGHRHSSSHVFIGSNSSHSNNVSSEKNVSVNNIEISVRRRSVDSVEGSTETGNSNDAETKNVKTNRVSEQEQRQPKDDYIFPIVRKANIKILEERRNKNLAFSNSRSDENEIVPTDRQQTRKNARTSDIQNREQVMTVNEAMTSASAAPSSPPRRVSRTSHIPTIVLTEEEDETIGESERQNNMSHSAEVRPPRVRRVARANNPFLIEVDSPAVSEKVRRSSAPSMTRRLTPGTGSGHGIVRSASNDHLTRHNFNHLDSYPHRPWSSEFFDLVINSDGYTKDERFKKIIDDRYDALFNNKHPYPMGMSRSDDLNFQQDLSPRIWKLLTSASHASLPRVGQGDTGYSSNRDIGDAELIPKLSPILDSTKSEELRLFKGITDCQNPERGSITLYPEFQLEIPRSNITSSDTQPGFHRKRHVTHTTAEHETVKARLVYIRDSQSPRPSLSPGTDGIDNGTEMQDTITLASLSGYTDHDNERSMQTEVSHPNESDNNNALTQTKTYWESFDDDLKEERPPVASKLVSDEVFTLDNRNSPTNLAEGVSELYSEETANKTSRSRVKGSLRHGFTEPAEADNTVIRVGDLDSAKEPVHYHINGTFSERKPILDSQSSISREIPSPIHSNPETFEDNFSVDTIKNSQAPYEGAFTISDTQADNGTQAVNDTHAVNDTLHKADQEVQHKQIIQTGPLIPPRRARRRAPNVPKQTRPPSPFLFTDRTDWQSKTFQTKKYSLENDTNAQVVPGNKNNDWDDKYHLRQSLLNERNDRSETSSIASMLDRAQQRSFSVGENTATSRTRPQRATSVETDQPSAHLTYFNKWSQFFNEMEPRFLSSANNTVLQHDISHDNASLSDPELEEYFGATVSPASVPTRMNEQNRMKALLLDDDDKSGAKISSV